MKPILFNTEMVKAILEGRKTVTRRVVKPQPDERHQHKLGYVTDSTNKKEIGCFGFGIDEYGGNIQYAKPPYRVGDILYVRETFFQAVSHYLDVSGECVSVLSPIFEYLADGQHTKGHWYNDRQDYYMVKRPSIHMPKEAARLFLRVTGVRVERLQDICNRGTPQEHITNITREGLQFQAVMENYQKLIDDFKKLWDSTIKENQIDTYGWNANPYVWVIEFKDISEDIKNGRV